MMAFNSLPLEVWLEIFSFLSVRDVMKIRLVCKQWNDLVNGEVKIKRLKCYHYIKFIERFSFDFYFNCVSAFLTYTSNDPKFSRVKYLHTDLKSKYAELAGAFRFLNSFKSLEETRFSLKAYGDFFGNPEAVKEQRFILHLDRLQMAKIDFYWSLPGPEISVVLDLASLIYLQINSLKGITIGQPKKLRTLVTKSLFESRVDYSQFTSLTTICTGEKDKWSISASFFEKLASLREVHLPPYHDYSFYYREKDEPPRQASVAGKARPKIFYFGFEITLNQINAEGELPDDLDGTEDPTRFIIQNVHRSVDNNPFVESIHYNAIASALNDSELFGVMLKKWPNICYLGINGNVADQSVLLKFIGQSKVKYLNFMRAPLPRSFFEKLAENGSFIEHLGFGPEHRLSLLSGDFDFVFKLKNLVSLAFEDCPLSLNFVAELLEQLKSIDYFWFNSVQQFGYRFSIHLHSNFSLTTILVSGSDTSSNRIRDQTALEFVNGLRTLSKSDGSVCPKELLILLRYLRHLEFERETHRFMMRKCIYDQTHSICLSLDQMSLFFPC